METMQRVNRNNLCPICHKPDWCLIAADNSAAICTRVSEGAKKRCGEAGWLHILRQNVPHVPYVPSRVVQRIEQSSGQQTGIFEELARIYGNCITVEQISELAAMLGVSVSSLRRLRIGWTGTSYSFPMCDAQGRIIGIRTRQSDGSKFCIKGSKTGLFVPVDMPVSDELLICEGTTDTAAALDLGFAAIGRPNCNSCGSMVTEIARGRKVVIVADNDEPGITGANNLARHLVLQCRSVRVITPPPGIKDLRAWLNNGLTQLDLQDSIKKTEPLGAYIVSGGSRK